MHRISTPVAHNKRLYGDASVDEHAIRRKNKDSPAGVEIDECIIEQARFAEHSQGDRKGIAQTDMIYSTIQGNAAIPKNPLQKYQAVSDNQRGIRAEHSEENQKKADAPCQLPQRERAESRVRLSIEICIGKNSSQRKKQNRRHEHHRAGIEKRNKLLHTANNIRL
ncbi:hypothetical protein [Solidesulfovibrio fructosivorans]|uniref:hypothetical protein n=1 Tax=Solidesulfovibrio fructosivorans TaxID=878 RepID=UPI001F35BA91|nr:hypothetical protein [Solidesulfovibrio fructosivorans]